MKLLIKDVTERREAYKLYYKEYNIYFKLFMFWAEIAIQIGKPFVSKGSYTQFMLFFPWPCGWVYFPGVKFYQSLGL